MTKKHMRIYIRRLSRRFCDILDRERDILDRFYSRDSYCDDAVGDNMPQIEAR